MKRATLKDIAEHLTISVSTVSRALTDDKNIRRETKDAVIEAAQKLGYKPNPIAKNLKFGRSNTIGVIVPEMVTPYASKVIEGVQQVLYKEGIKVIIAESGESWERERDNIATMEHFMVDGIIICSCDYIHNRAVYEHLLNLGMPVVFFDRIPHGIEAPQVIVDDYLKSFFLVESLIRSGRKKIVHLHGNSSVYNAYLRAKAYRDALHKFKINLDEANYVIDCGLSFENGAEAADRLINEGVEFDAIFAFTDTLAIGAMNRLKERGVKIPHQVAIASFSGTILSTIVTPPLTTVEPPLTEMGRESALLILEKIKDSSCPNRSILLDAEIIYRASTEIE
ncbi:MAG: LacI family DNA-binding transcriptional regulator [Rikenellaceae bacterium]